MAASLVHAVAAPLPSAGRPARAFHPLASAPALASRAPRPRPVAASSFRSRPSRRLVPGVSSEGARPVGVASSPPSRGRRGVQGWKMARTTSMWRFSLRRLRKLGR
ncbi:hypothetical protein EJB05_18592 [Eragrostis curvula]|uniref:Uncharacterized protein n=1 Tax=Eragrostis curvula TaxID=38414 RepID=A0A5J9VNL9_9POAL|nr:hypothetical protein EJB05_18592 [Eragrostis curvula]